MAGLVQRENIDESGADEVIVDVIPRSMPGGDESI